MTIIRKKLLGKRAKIALIVSLLVLMNSDAAVSYSEFLGVTEGAWAVYKVETMWESTVPEDAPPKSLLDINQTLWNVTIVKILGPDTLRLRVVKELKNGTKVEYYEGSVRWNSSELKSWVVRKNLDVGDKIYEKEEVKVNKTEYCRIGGASRWLVYMETEYKDIIGGDLRGISTYSVYWDRETGILCSMLIKRTDYKDPYNPENFAVSWIWIHIVETSLWANAENSNSGGFFSYVVATIIILVCGLIIFLLIRGCTRQRRKIKRHERYAASRAIG